MDVLTASPDEERLLLVLYESLEGRPDTSVQTRLSTPLACDAQDLVAFHGS